MTQVTGVTEFKAIETEYKGFRFRSRLEARWAVFFDAAGIVWDYEREGFRLPSGMYLPDFWLPRQQCFVEVKGHEPTESEERICAELAQASGKDVYLCYGPIPSGESFYAPDGVALDSALAWTNWRWNRVEDGWSGTSFWWCECPECGQMHMAHQGRVDEACLCRGRVNVSKHSYHATPGLRQAYVAARSARFEHGEEPNGD